MSALKYDDSWLFEYHIEEVKVHPPVDPHQALLHTTLPLTERYPLAL